MSNISVVHQGLESGHRQPRRMFVQIDLGQIERAERGVEMEVELVEVACLAVAQACVLLCVAEADVD